MSLRHYSAGKDVCRETEIVRCSVSSVVNTGSGDRAVGYLAHIEFDRYCMSDVNGTMW